MSTPLPSPGHTTLTDLGDGTFQVDSFFDITYRIDFQGAPGGALDGLSGSTEGTIRVTACDEESAPAHNFGESFTCVFETGIESIFTDGFESGNVSAWSTSVPGR